MAHTSELIAPALPMSVEFLKSEQKSVNRPPCDSVMECNIPSALAVVSPAPHSNAPCICSFPECTTYIPSDEARLQHNREKHSEKWCCPMCHRFLAKTSKFHHQRSCGKPKLAVVRKRNQKSKKEKIGKNVKDDDRKLTTVNTMMKVGEVFQNVTLRVFMPRNSGIQFVNSHSTESHPTLLGSKGSLTVSAKGLKEMNVVTMPGKNGGQNPAKPEPIPIFVHTPSACTRPLGQSAIQNSYVPANQPDNTPATSDGVDFLAQVIQSVPGLKSEPDLPVAARQDTLRFAEYSNPVLSQILNAPLDSLPALTSRASTSPSKSQRPRRATVKRNEKLRCIYSPDCPQEFSRQDDRRRHVAEHHEGQHSFACPDCGKQMLKRSLNRHRSTGRGCQPGLSSSRMQPDKVKSQFTDDQEMKTLKSVTETHSVEQLLPPAGLPSSSRPNLLLDQLSGKTVSGGEIDGGNGAEFPAQGVKQEPVEEGVGMTAMESTENVEVSPANSSVNLKSEVKQEAVDASVSGTEITVRIQENNQTRLLQVPKNRISEWLKTVALKDGGKQQRISFWAQ